MKTKNYKIIDYSKQVRMERIRRKALEANRDLALEVEHAIAESNKSEIARLADTLTVRAMIAQELARFTNRK